MKKCTLHKILSLVLVTALVACVNTPANFKPAGFESWEEAKEYLIESEYFAKKLSPEEWSSFYRRFPEYWDDIQTAKKMGSTLEFHPVYTAYAYRWTSLKRKTIWSPEVLARLERKEASRGDDIFKITYALGAPARVLYDNDFEILLYKDGSAIILNDGTYRLRTTCLNCWVRPVRSGQLNDGIPDNEVITRLGLVRQTYK